MNDKLLQTIAYDLKINRFEKDLSPYEYRCAVIYSATALWAKVATQDLLKDTEKGSRRHVLNVCASFLSNVLADEGEEVKSYFFDGHHSNLSPQTKIVDSLIRVRELNEIGMDSNKLILSLPDDVVFQISDNLQTILGSIGSSKNYEFLSGLSFTYKDVDGVCPKLRNNIEYVERYLVQLSKKKPSRTKALDGDCYFDIYEYGERRFSRNKPHGSYPFELIMNRMIDGEKYYLKTERGYFEFSELESNIREHCRFMIYLCHIFGKKTFKIIENDAVIYLKGHHALPLYEDCLIRSILWPMRNIDDAAWFFGPREYKPFIIQVLSSLGLVF